MHSNVEKMLSEIGCAMPLGSGAFGVLCLSRSAVTRPAFRSIASLSNNSIHSFINLTHSL